MRQFVVVAHELCPSAEINLDDLPGTGRLDLLCRCVTSALLLSHDIRENVGVHLVVDGYIIRFEGAKLRRLNPDERSTAALIRDALAARDEAIGEMEVQTSPGVSIRHGTFESMLAGFDEGSIIQLHAEGGPVIELEPPAEPIFVLSDHREFTEHEQKLLGKYATDQVSLGPQPLHADQAITVAHNYLDTGGFTTY